MLPQIDQYLPERAAAVRQKLTDFGMNNNQMANNGKSDARNATGFKRRFAHRREHCAPTNADADVSTSCATRG